MGEVGQSETRVSAYYNENDAFAAQWLRELIKAGLIADGEVDDRDIQDVQAHDLRGFVQCHFFAGIGGWSYALRLAGWPDDRPVWTGSCPCQPFSGPGGGQGEEDPRHLWPVWFPLIQERRPSVVFGEQVANPDGLGWIDGVWADLEDEGYAFAATDLCAAGVGAPHIRQRIYWVGDAQREGLEGYGRDGTTAGEAESIRSDATTGGGGITASGLDAMHLLRRVDLRDSQRTRSRLRVSPDRRVGRRPLWAEFEALACADGWRRVQSGTFPMAHGVSERVGRLRGYGNAIVPQVAAAFIEAYLDTQEGASA